MKKKLTRANGLVLKFLTVCDKNQRNIILRTLTDQQLQILVEIIYNLVKGGFHISKKYRDALSLKKTNIRSVIEESISKRLRRKRLLKISEVIPIILQAFFKYESGASISTKEEI